MTDALEPADEHLVSLSKDGNLGAFNSLVERYQGAVYNLCRRLTGEPGAAEDATQEAFLSAYRSITRFKGGSFRSWMLRIAANECKDELRRRSRRPAESREFSPREEEQQLDITETPESPPDYVERVALGESIQSALLTLPFEQRQAILLSDLHGYHYEEIAEMSGSNVGTVKSRIHRGRERLRAMLAEDPELLGRLRRLEQ